jgi:hypothetical protein
MNVYKLLSLIFVFLYFSNILMGQGHENFLEDVPKLAVKLNLVAAFDVFEPTIAASFEHRLANRHYLEHEFGYIYDNPWKMSDKLRGLRYRLGYHYVHEENNLGNRYVGIQIHYRQLFGEIEDFVWRKGFSFQQKLKQYNTFHSYGFTVIFGKVRFLRGDRWFTDYQIGAGFSWKPFKIENYPVDAESPDYASWIYNSRVFANNGNTLRNGENPLYLNMLMTVKIGYYIR